MFSSINISQNPIHPPHKHKAGSLARLDRSSSPGKNHMGLVSMVGSSPKNFQGEGPVAGEPVS